MILFSIGCVYVTLWLLLLIAISVSAYDESQWFETQRRLRRELVAELQEHAHLGQLINRINVTVDAIVDATVEQMHSVVHLGNSCPFRRTVIHKMLRNEKVKIIIGGGSVTYGADLRDRNAQRWSTPFTDILNSGWYAPGFEVVNLGSPACNVDYWLYRVREFSTADFVIIDLSVNDQGFDLQALPHLYHSFIQLIDDLPNHPSILVHQAFRSGDRDIREIQGHCPLVNTSITCCHGEIFFCRKWYDMSDFVSLTLNTLRVPRVSYRDLVWPSYWQPPENLNLFWNGKSHPDAKAHQLMAKLIAYAFMLQVKDAHRASHCMELAPDDSSTHASTSNARYVEQQHRDRSVVSLCANPLTLMNAKTDDLSSRSSFHVLIETTSTTTSTSQSSQLPTLSSTWKALPLSVMEVNGWKFFNDSKGKYGWIFESHKQDMLYCETLPLARSACSAQTLSLEIELSDSQPIVQIHFLKSYAQEMGIARVWLDHHEEESLLLDSRWDVEYSVTHSVTLSRNGLRDLSSTLTGESYQWPSLTAGKHILHIAPAQYKTDKFKWKLLGVTSC